MSQREMIRSWSMFWIVAAILAWIVLSFLAGDMLSGLDYYQAVPACDDVRPRGC